MPINSLLYPSNVFVPAPFNVDNSVRFNDGSSDYLTKSNSSAGSTSKSTISLWTKRSGTSSYQDIWESYNDGSNYFRFRFRDDNRLDMQSDISNSTVFLKRTTRVFRDISAWYHICVKIDLTQSNADKIKLFINGTRETTFDNSTDLTSTSQQFVGGGGSYNFTIGRHPSSDAYYDGYMAEYVFIDGQALDPTSFGEFDEDSGIWKPIDVSGLTFGTNGFYLEFKQSGTGTNASGIGADTSGNNHHFAVTNLTAVDQSTDTCTNNFATMNPLDNFYYNGVFSEGNLKIINGSGREAGATSTIALSSGKWFWEAKPKSNVAPVIGIQPAPSAANTSSSPSMQVNGFGYLKNGKVETSNGSGGSTVLASYASYVADDIIGVALDLDSSQAKIYFYKNGALQGSGVNITSASSTTNGHYFVGFGVLGGQDTFEVNFGSPPYANSSGNADGNGFGDFEYAPKSGHLAICTKNLAENG